MTDRPLPKKGEVSYFYGFDKNTNKYTISIVSSTGSEIKLSCDGDDESIEELNILIANFHRHVIEVTEQFLDYQKRWFDESFEEIAKELEKE